MAKEKGSALERRSKFHKKRENLGRIGENIGAAVTGIGLGISLAGGAAAGLPLAASGAAMLTGGAAMRHDAGKKGRAIKAGIRHKTKAGHGSEAMKKARGLLAAEKRGKAASAKSGDKPKGQVKAHGRRTKNGPSRVKAHTRKTK